MKFRNYDFGNKYKILPNGDIFSNVSRKTLSTFSDGRRGYLKVKLYDKDGVPRTISQHRLIMEVLNPVDNMSDLEVDHIDGNYYNNNPENLKWVDRKENLRFKGKGTHKDKVRYHKSMICELFFKKGFSRNHIAKSLNLDIQSVSDFLSGKCFSGYAKTWCELNKLPYIL